MLATRRCPASFKAHPESVRPHHGLQSTGDYAACQEFLLEEITAVFASPVCANDARRAGGLRLGAERADVPSLGLPPERTRSRLRESSCRRGLGDPHVEADLVGVSIGPLLRASSLNSSIRTPKNQPSDVREARAAVITKHPYDPLPRAVVGHESPCGAPRRRRPRGRFVECGVASLTDVTRFTSLLYSFSEDGDQHV